MIKMEHQEENSLSLNIKPNPYKLTFHKIDLETTLGKQGRQEQVDLWLKKEILQYCKEMKWLRKSLNSNPEPIGLVRKFDLRESLMACFRKVHHTSSLNFH